MVSYLEEAWAGMSWAERRVFSAAAKALGHTKATLAQDHDTTVMLRKIAAEAGKSLGAEAAEMVAEVLFDAVHEHCGDDGCTGGGVPWYQQIAARLIDPYGPHAAIAGELHRLRQDDETAGECDVDGWQPVIADRFHAVEYASGESRRQRLIELAAVAAAEVSAMDAARYDEPASTVARPSAGGARR